MRRWCVRIAVVVVLGVVLTYLGAWTCWLVPSQLGYPDVLETPDDWPSVWPASYPDDWRAIPRELVVLENAIARSEIFDASARSLWIESVGWPAFAVACETWTDQDGDSHTSGIDLSEYGIEAGAGTGSVLPLRPILPGFLINFTVACAMVATAWLGAAGIEGALRRRVRRRGRCIECGYDLAGLDTCPECGPAAGPRVTG